MSPLTTQLCCGCWFIRDNSSHGFKRSTADLSGFLSRDFLSLFRPLWGSHGFLCGSLSPCALNQVTLITGNKIFNFATAPLTLTCVWTLLRGEEDEEMKWQIQSDLSETFQFSRYTQESERVQQGKCKSHKVWVALEGGEEESEHSFLLCSLLLFYYACSAVELLQISTIIKRSLHSSCSFSHCHSAAAASEHERRRKLQLFQFHCQKNVHSRCRASDVKMSKCKSFRTIFSETTDESRARKKVKNNFLRLLFLAQTQTHFWFDCQQWKISTALSFSTCLVILCCDSSSSSLRSEKKVSSQRENGEGKKWKFHATR